MKRGFIAVSDEIMNHEDYPLMDVVIKSVITEVRREKMPNGITRIYGTSEYFDKCVEGQEKEYWLWLRWENGIIVFDKLTPELPI